MRAYHVPFFQNLVSSSSKIGPTLNVSGIIHFGPGGGLVVLTVGGGLVVVEVVVVAFTSSSKGSVEFSVK